MIRKWLSFIGNLVHRRGGSSDTRARNRALTTHNTYQIEPGQTQTIDYSSAEFDAFAARSRRHADAMARLSDAGRADWPPVYVDPFPGLVNAVPEICAADLTVDVVGGAVAHHGVLLIRGLLNNEQVAEVRAVQDRIKASSLLAPPRDREWYSPFDGKSKHEHALRIRTQSRGGNWLADSPLGLTKVLRLLETVGVVDVLQEHFQERPAISLQKSTLRCVQPEPQSSGWHQDGSFLGKDVRSMNVWVALSPCGGSIPASGIELIPHRFKEIVPPNPTLGIATIPFEVVEDIKKTHPAVLPKFAPGDALIFDELLVHRTSLPTGISTVRYALECWFFAPSHSSPTYLPFLA